MKTCLIDIIAGARPNFMKIGPILQAWPKKGTIRYRLVHTGQHYDRAMSGNFFRQLGIPKPDVNLKVGSGSQAKQTAEIMRRYEALLARKPADICLVVGDVNSTMACAIVAKKAGLKVAHVEAGLRSGDWRMPEEVNRVATDALSDLCFTTSVEASQTLLREGKKRSQVHFVGNTMADSLLAHRKRFRPPLLWRQVGLRKGEYLVLTLHRPSNVDHKERLAECLRTIVWNSRGYRVIFPAHPRTAKTLKLIKLDKFAISYPPSAHIRQSALRPIFVTPPLSYLEFNYLVEHAKAVITDSGGITEETTVMGVPCLTLRDTTERPETVTMGTNELIGTNPKKLGPAVRKLFEGVWKKGKIPPRWDGKTAKRIVKVLKVRTHKGRTELFKGSKQ